MVVDAHRVVAAADEAIDEAVGNVVVGVVCREAEVHAVEALLHPRKPLELEVAAHGLEPAVLAGRGVLESLVGEVKCGAGDDVFSVVHTYPVAAGVYVERLGIGEFQAVGRGKRHLPDEAVAGCKRPRPNVA